MIAAFVADKMTRYIAGGLSREQAAYFTRGELEAIYRGNHWSRNSTENFGKTPPPEMLDIEAAMTKCNSAIASHRDAVAAQDRETHGSAPENTPQTQKQESGAKLNNLDSLKNYVKRRSP